MKTTENVSLAGYAFKIETDAYAELETYLEEIRNGFRGDASADEIVADIEERIAELLRERCVSGMVVEMAMVHDIMKRIGDPKELAQEDVDPAFGEPGASGHETGKATAEKKASDKKNWKSRRLFRNMDERVIGGVCSGLGTYFGLDKVIFRIFFMISFFIGLIGIDDGPYIMISVIAYLCLWIAMPAARTAEQKREMKGRPMNLNNYRDKGFDFEKEVREVAESPAGQTAKRAGGVFLGILLLIIGLGGLLGCIFIPSLPAVIGHGITDDILRLGPLDSGEQIGADLVTSTTFWGMVLITVGLFCIWFIYNGIMLLFDLKSPSWRPGLILFIAWLISIFALAAWVIKTVADALPLIV